MKSKYLHVKSCKYLLYKQLERKVRILFHWISISSSETERFRWWEIRTASRIGNNSNLASSTCQIGKVGYSLANFFIVRNDRLNLCGWTFGLSLYSNSPIILKQSHQELTPNYSSIIKAGDVLMQRIVRDLFTLWSSALAVVPVWVQLWCPPLMVAHNTFAAIEFEELYWLLNPPKTRLFSSKVIWM